MAKVYNAMDCAYNIVKKRREKDASFLLSSLWNEVSEKLELDKQKGTYSIGEFLGDMMQDVRFVHISDDRWKLRENMKLEEWDKISKSMLGSREYLEEGYEEDFHETEVDEKDVEYSEDIISDMDEGESDIDDFDVHGQINDDESIFVDKILDTSEDE